MKIRLAVFVAALVVLVSPSSTDAAPRSDDRFCYTCEVWAEDTEIWIPQLGRFAIRPYSASCEAYTGDNMAHGLWDTCETNPGSYTIVNGEVEFQIGCNGLQENELCNNDEGFLSLVDLGKLCKSDS